MSQIASETLAAIPWLSHYKLPLLMKAVAERGPHDRGTWIRMTARADQIMHTLQPPDVTIMLKALCRVKYRDESFLNKLASNRIPSMFESSNVYYACSIAHSLAKLNVYSHPCFLSLSAQIQRRMSSCDALSLTLAMPAFTAVGGGEGFFAELIAKFAERLPQVVHQCTADGLSVIFKSLSSYFPHLTLVDPSTSSSVTSGILYSSSLIQIFTAIPHHLPNMSITSLTNLLMALARLDRLKTQQPDQLTAARDCVDLASQELQAKLPTVQEHF
eukprot:GHVS01035710.1.p1 GENE.GHVS01035710.1~~GHVS01035710.1.p1  ORF type:complete len:273 (-),score=33.50 GHVS01035710.1:113-931(-)